MFENRVIFAKVNVKNFIASGIIETFCLGFSSEEENELVESMAAAHPEVQEEINQVRTSLDSILKSSEIKPAGSVKTAVMNSIYSQQAALQPIFIPLLNTIADFTTVEASAIANQLQGPTEDFENLYMQELPSTREIINFAVWIKKGHEEEMHTDRNEYIAVLEGSCEMIMNNKRIAYSKGDIISIDRKSVV